MKESELLDKIGAIFSAYDNRVLEFFTTEDASEEETLQRLVLSAVDEYLDFAEE